MAQFTQDRVKEYLIAALQILDKNEGELPVKQILKELENKISFSHEEKEIKDGVAPRWVKVFQFASIGLVRAAWIRKSKGIWYLTDEGKEALKLEPKKFREILEQRYKDSMSATRNDGVITDEAINEVVSENVQGRSFEQAEADARDEIKKFITRLNPYEFQDLVAALFRGMGYYTPFVAPRGPDGGIDVVAYKDPIGAESPRIRIQVKHRVENKVSSPEVKSLGGNLHREGYIGVIVSSGGFTSDSLTSIRESGKHIEKIDLDDFINLWEQHYANLTDEDKVLLPIRKISFLAPIE